MSFRIPGRLGIAPELRLAKVAPLIILETAMQKFLLSLFALAAVSLTSAESPVVVIQTTLGDIEVELYPDVPLETVTILSIKRK